MVRALRTVAAAAVLLGAAACGTDEGPRPTRASPPPAGSTDRPATPSETPTATAMADPEPTAETPCLVTAEQLTALSGTPQEIRDTVGQSGGPGTVFTCETALDERGVYMEWSLLRRLPFVPTREEQRAHLATSGTTPVAVDLGAGHSGWAGSSRLGGLLLAEVVTVLEGQVLQASVLVMDADTGMRPAQLRDEAVALARALVAASTD